MPAIRDFAVTEVTAAAATATPDMPEHEAGDLLIVFANKDSTTGMVETTGLYTLLQSGDITTTAWSGAYWRRALSNAEPPPIFTWTSETANFVIVAVKNVHPSNAPTGYLSADDSTIPFTQNQSIATPNPNCLVLHGVGNDVGIGAEPYPGVAQVLYGGDAGANGIGVSWAFYKASGSIGNPTFWGRAEAPTQIHTVVIEDDGDNSEVQGYVDRGLTPCTLVCPLPGATLFGWAHQTSLSPLVIGNEWTQVWTFSASGSVWTDQTVNMNDPGTADVPTNGLVNSAFYLGSDTQFFKFGLYVSAAGAGGSVVYEYASGSAWAQVPGLANALTATGAHDFQFAAAPGWASIDVNGVAKYYIRGRVATARTAGPTFSQGLRDGACTAYDLITAGADLGVNPYHNVAQITPASVAYRLGGNEILFSGGTDLSSGYLLSTFFFTSPRDWVDLSFLNRLGIVIHMMDTSNNFRSWIVGAKDGKTTFADRRNVFAIQVDETEGSYFAQQGSLNAALIDTIGLLSVQPYGTMSLCFSMLMRTGTIVLAGGTPALPLDFDAIVDAVVNGCSLFPMLYKVGSVATVWAPIRIGGGDPVHAVVNLRTFEFPTHYDRDAKLLDYHVDANENGIEFYGKAGDTVQFTNCVFVSGSPYYWRINASASPSASWDFKGTSVIEGTVVLKDVMDFEEMKFVGCPSIDASDCTLLGCAISDVPAASNSITFTTGSSVQNCTLDLSQVGTGSYWCSVADPGIFQGDTFVGGGGHAIRITTPGSYSLVDDVWTGFGANGTMLAAIFNDSGGTVTLNVSGGTTPTYRNGAGASTTIVNAVTVRVTAKSAATGLPVEGARVYLEATAGGPMSEGDEILNTLTNASGIAEITDFNYTADQPFTGVVRKGSASPLYKSSPVSGTIEAVTGFQTIVFLVADE